MLSRCDVATGSSPQPHYEAIERRTEPLSDHGIRSVLLLYVPIPMKNKKRNRFFIGGEGLGVMLFFLVWSELGFRYLISYSNSVMFTGSYFVDHRLPVDIMQSGSLLHSGTCHLNATNCRMDESPA